MAKGKTKKKSTKKYTEKEKDKVKTTKGIKRIAGKDVSGDLTLPNALLQIKGIGLSLNRIVARHIAKKLNIPVNIQVGDLSEEQIEKIDAILTNLSDEPLPSFLFNRRKDFYEGKDKHYIMNDLIFAVKQDIDREKKLYTWRGFRHAYGQKVRGQRTKSTGRRGMTVGVIRKGVAGTQPQKQESKK